MVVISSMCFAEVVSQNLVMGLGDRLSATFQIEVASKSTSLQFFIDEGPLRELADESDIQIQQLVSDRKPGDQHTADLTLEIVTSTMAPSFTELPLTIQWRDLSGQQQETIIYLTVQPVLVLRTYSEESNGRLKIWWSLLRDDLEEEPSFPIRVRAHDEPLQLIFENQNQIDLAYTGIRIHGEGMIKHGSFSDPADNLIFNGDRYHLIIDSGSPGRGSFRCHNNESGTQNRQILFNQSIDE